MSAPLKAAFNATASTAAAAATAATTAAAALAAAAAAAAAAAGLSPGTHAEKPSPVTLALALTIWMSRLSGMLRTEWKAAQMSHQLQQPKLSVAMPEYEEL